MNIGSVGTQNTSLVEMLRLAAQKATSSTEQTGSESGSDDFKVSGPAELMSKLQQLKEKDPEQFQEVVEQLAEDVAAQAEEAEGEEQNRLTHLAEMLGQVAETGDLSALQPPQGGPGQGGTPPPGGMPPGGMTGADKAGRAPGTYGPNGQMVEREEEEDGSIFQTLLARIDAALAAADEDEKTTLA